ncbi:MAG: hypothetical protein K1Y36_26805, partial [Blastocatellia bacterium]|nr:hypothetical protein [Blastocatellia bacterium]
LISRRPAKSCGQVQKFFPTHRNPATTTNRGVRSCKNSVLTVVDTLSQWLVPSVPITNGLTCLAANSKTNEGLSLRVRHFYFGRHRQYLYRYWSAATRMVPGSLPKTRNGIIQVIVIDEANTSGEAKSTSFNHQLTSFQP